MDALKAVFYGTSLTMAGYGIGFGIVRGGMWAVVTALCAVAAILLCREAPALFVREPSRGE